MVELRGSKLLRLLLEDCKHSEEKHDDPKTSGMPRSTQFVNTGYLLLKHLIDVLGESSHLVLSKMQILVLISSANLEPDGKVDYYKLLPYLVNSLDIMTDKENAQQREIMIATAAHDYDVGEIVQGTSYSIKSSLIMPF